MKTVNRVLVDTHARPYPCPQEHGVRSINAVTPDRAPTLRYRRADQHSKNSTAHATPPFLRLLQLTERHQKEPRLTQELSASPTNGVIYFPALSEHRPSQEDR